MNAIFILRKWKHLLQNNVRYQGILFWQNLYEVVPYTEAQLKTLKTVSKCTNFILGRPAKYRFMLSTPRIHIVSSSKVLSESVSCYAKSMCWDLAWQRFFCCVQTTGNAKLHLFTTIRKSKPRQRLKSCSQEKRLELIAQIFF